ncbi:MAG: hypothetical protein SGI74_08280 [Oligoflexia bacterium]|nr:hypothetical protein [Oligoflexia bacterium]
MIHKLKWNILASYNSRKSERRSSAIFILLILFLAIPPANAELARRALELELEDVEGVTGYELEVVRILDKDTKKPPVKFKIKTSKWTAKLVPGKYELRVRSLDSRGVPGEWSPAQEFAVKLPPVSIIKPAIGVAIKSEETQSDKVEFEWKPVDGAEKYKVRVLNKAGTVVEEVTETGTSAKLKIPVAESYTWQVIPLAQGDLEGEELSPPGNFEFHGATLELPRISEIEDTNTALMNWEQVEFAQKYDYILEQKTETGDWKNFEHRFQKTPKRTLAKPLPSGKYRVKIRALADMRGPSEFAVKEFTSQNIGSRSPAAVEQVKSEGSFGSKSQFFAVASYFLSMVNYTGLSADTSTGVNYNAIGGTGRLGAGVWFSKDSNWGSLLIADMSGFTLKTTTYRYVAGSLVGVHRYRLGAIGQLRTYFGAQYRELPFSEGDPTNPTEFVQKTITTAGPLLGVSLAHGFSRRIGFQINVQASHSMMGMKTPNGGANIATPSYQAGLLGSLSLSDSLVGFMGYAYKVEAAKFAFKDVGLAAPEQANTLSITGHYINFMLEYGF